MTTANRNPDVPTAAGVSIRRLPRRLREAGAQRLIESTSQAVTGGARRFLDAAAGQGYSLRDFWGAIEVGASGDERVLEACLCVTGAGRTAMLFLSRPTGRPAETRLARVVREATDELEEIRLAQALLLPEEQGSERALADAGFERVAELAYLRRPRVLPIDAGLHADLPAGIEIVPGAEVDDDDLILALDRSYEGTLDCPTLCGKRDTRDVLESHRSVGEHDPSLWWVIRDAGEVVGAMLFTPIPDQSAIELVYLGVSPSMRGRGVAAAVFAEGIHRLRAREEASITCAVDLQNVPARRLYERFGFVETARRVAMVRVLTEA